jgi:hypothetical protein
VGLTWKCTNPVEPSLGSRCPGLRSLGGEVAAGRAWVWGQGPGWGQASSLGTTPPWLGCSPDKGRATAFLGGGGGGGARELTQMWEAMTWLIPSQQPCAVLASHTV